MDAPDLWLIAGPNGAGKTTVTRNRPLSELLAGVCFLNPDVRTLELPQQRASPLSQKRAASLRFCAS